MLKIKRLYNRKKGVVCIEYAPIANLFSEKSFLMSKILWQVERKRRLLNKRINPVSLRKTSKGNNNG